MRMCASSWSQQVCVQQLSSHSCSWNVTVGSTPTSVYPDTYNVINMVTVIVLRRGTRGRAWRPALGAHAGAV
jgi:hypothetical protein